MCFFDLFKYFLYVSGDVFLQILRSKILKMFTQSKDGVG